MRGAALAGIIALLAGCATEGGREVAPIEAARANARLGVAYLQQGNLSLAKEKLERAEKQDPRNAEVQSALGFLYEQLDRKADAERRYAQARRLSPNSGEVANTYGVFLCRNGKAPQALREFEAAARNPLYATPWAALTNAAVCLRSVQRTADAIPYLQQAIHLRPNYAEAVSELADLQLSLGDVQAAGNTVNNYLTLGLGNPEVLLVGLRAAKARGDNATVDNYARRLRRDFPNSVQTRALPQILSDNRD
jgi:type IV pilus assembly protein PilF